MAISAEEMDALSADIANLMYDRMRLLRWEPGDPGPDGMPTERYRADLSSPCFYRVTGGRESEGTAQAQTTSAAMSLPLGVPITNRDRVQLTHRLGRALAEPPIFEVTDLTQGLAGIRLQLSPASNPALILWD